MASKFVSTLFLMLTGVLLLVGCGTYREKGPTDKPGPFEHKVPVEASQEEPSHALNLESGERILFFADPDGSVGLMSEVALSSGQDTTLNDARLQEASPAMIYFAVTTDGEIPAELVAHHEGLARDGELPPLADALAGRDRGWFLEAPSTQAPSQCVNAVFRVHHCEHPFYDEAFCRLNTSGTWSWQVPGANRYKAGFCLQQGNAHSWLYSLTEASNCTYFQSANFIWGFNSAVLGEAYSAPTYRTYVWWRGSGSPHRKFFHFGGEGQDDLFDFGTRYSWESCP